MKISQKDLKELHRRGKVTSESGEPVLARDLRPKRKIVEVPPQARAEIPDLSLIIKAISVFSDNSEQTSKEVSDSIVEALNELTSAIKAQEKKSYRKLKITKIERDGRGLMTSVEIEETGAS